MKWIVQDNLYREEQDFQLVKDTFDRFNVEYLPVTINQGVISPEIPWSNEPTMILGGYSLMRYARDNNLIPGCFYENMDVLTWIEKYQEHMLNSDAQITTLENVREQKLFFLRPEEDSKAFAGKTFENWEDFVQWRQDTIATSSICSSDTLVVSAELKAIHRETRFFIIDKTIVSSSVYKINGDMRTSLYINQSEIDFVNDMIAIWVPNRAFVMDVATTDTGHKIVELNCINCSGFYEADIQKILMTMNTMEY